MIGDVEGPGDQVHLADGLGLPTVGLGGAGVGPAVIRRFAGFDRLYLALDRDRAGRRARAAFAEALGTRVIDFHLWEIGPAQWACVVTLVAVEPRAVAEYRRAVLAAEHVHHLTIEVHPQRVAAAG